MNTLHNDTVWLFVPDVLQDRSTISRMFLTIILLLYSPLALHHRRGVIPHKNTLRRAFISDMTFRWQTWWIAAARLHGVRYSPLFQGYWCHWMTDRQCKQDAHTRVHPPGPRLLSVLDISIHDHHWPDMFAKRRGCSQPKFKRISYIISLIGFLPNGSAKTIHYLY